jgi:prephenate dehydrogenase
LKIAVIGSSGGMGSLFVRYFLSRKFEVTGSDVKRTAFKSPRFHYFRSNTDAVRAAEFVLLATPIDNTVQAAKEMLPAMDEGSTLVEICSVKGKILPSLRRLLSLRGRRLLSIHPLFGPSIGTFNGMKVAVVTRDRTSDMKIARKLLHGASLFALEEGEHDRLMALALSLQHVLNLAYAKTLARYVSPSDFRKVSTPNSLIQLTLAEGVLAQNPSLYSFIQIGNEHSKDVIESLAQEIGAIQEIIRIKDRRKFEEFFTSASNFYHNDLVSHRVLEKIYRASELMQDE